MVPLAVAVFVHERGALSPTAMRGAIAACDLVIVSPVRTMLYMLARRFPSLWVVKGRGCKQAGVNKRGGKTR